MDKKEILKLKRSIGIRNFGFKLWDNHNKKFIETWKDANKLSLGTAGVNKHLSIAYATEPDVYLTIVRYTGIKDQYNQDIYEGDIVSYINIDGVYQKGVIIYDNLFCRFLINAVDGYDNENQDVELHISIPINYIANIFENPEYLE